MFQIGNIIFPTTQTDEAYIITQREISLNEGGKASENWIIRGFQLKYIVSKYIVKPQTGNAYDVFTGTSEEGARYYIQSQILNGGPGREYPNLVLDDINLNRGTNRTYSGRYENLADFITNILDYDKLGWNISLDIPNERFVFTILEGVERTPENVNTLPVILSTDFNTLREMNYTQTLNNYYNVVTVGGPGQGTDRIIVTVGQSDGVNVRERFLDARNIPTENEDGTPRALQDIEADLIAYGTEFINNQQINFASGQLLPRTTLQYKLDYNVGDVVTIQNRSWGVQFNARITSVRLATESGRNIIEHIFDNDRPNIISVFNDRLNNVNNELFR